MNVIIAGCGEIGAELALIASKTNHDVVVIDENEQNFDNLSSDFVGLKFCGLPIDEDTLIKAGIRSCDVFYAVSQDDNMNLMAAQLAKTVFGVDKVIAQVVDSRKESVFEKTNLITVCPTNLTVDSLVSALGDFSGEKLLRVKNHTVKMFSVTVPKEMVGKKALDIILEENEILYAVIGNDGEFRLVSNYNIVLNEGETLIFSKVVD